MDPYKIKMRETKPYSSMNKENKLHEQQFKPAGSVKSFSTVSPYMPPSFPKKESRRDKSGEVRTGPPNFVTNPPRKGNGAATPGVLFTKMHYEHIPDPYSSKDDERTRQRYISSSLVYDKEKPYTSATHPSNRTFTEDKDIYDQKAEIKAKPAAKRRYVGYKHEFAFKPTSHGKKGINCTLGRMPSYHEQSMPILTKRRMSKDDERPGWKPPTTKRSVP